MSERELPVADTERPLNINDPIPDLLFRKAGLTQEQAVRCGELLRSEECDNGATARAALATPAESAEPAGVELPTEPGVWERTHGICDEYEIIVRRFGEQIEVATGVSTPAFLYTGWCGRERVKGNVDQLPCGGWRKAGTSELDDNRLLKAGIESFMKDALVAIAGAVCTPERGYLEDGGFSQLLADIKRLRKQHDQHKNRNGVVAKQVEDRDSKLHAAQQRAEAAEREREKVLLHALVGLNVIEQSSRKDAEGDAFVRHNLRLTLDQVADIEQETADYNATTATFMQTMQAAEARIAVLESSMRNAKNEASICKDCTAEEHAAACQRVRDICDAALQPAAGGADDDFEPIAEGDFHRYVPPGRIEDNK